VIVTVVGDAFLDRDIEGNVERVCPDAPAPVVDVTAERTRPGGAALAAVLAAAAAPAGSRLRLVAAFGDDAAAEELRALLERAGVEVVAMVRKGPTIEKARVRSAGQSVVRLDRGRRADRVEAPASTGDALADADAVLVADYGAGSAAAARRWLAGVPSRRPVVWDPHPEGARPVTGAWLATPSEREALAASGLHEGPRLRQAEKAGRMLARSWGVRAVAVTLGGSGAMLVEQDGPPLMVPTEPFPGDSCGAGDCLAATATVALAGGALPSEALTVGVAAASRFVAAGGAARIGASDGVARMGAPPRAARIGASDGVARIGAAGAGAGGGGENAAALARRVRASGGTVVATGGCFDLVHAGHVAVLEQARRLGDCLIVCLNSDASVTRLKGPGRPVQNESDRAAVLRALGAVDAVAVFDEDTPVRLLGALRPHLFVKGGDYALGELPEARAMAAWGGQVVILPYLGGRSTTALLQRATRG